MDCIKPSTVLRNFHSLIMDRVILVSCAVILVSQFCFEVILASQRFDGTSGTKGIDDDKYSLFTSRLGRKKRNSKEETYNKPSEQELAELVEAYEDSPLALIAVNGNDKLVCKNIKGKRSSFTPRLGRNIDDDLSGVSGNEKWLQDDDNSAEYVIQRSPPFAPRLGKRMSTLYAPRLGRDL
ncbi:unnamed protein product [Phaedon cochleariae]|uniref:Pheromone biosynthesis activating neuropeptide n=1 Tax=Phaedon cochleariae TaxID=80249 RepID=A0A9P0DQ84_PHACE|nr:unnamed protein product [Phaedon cochleariae]